MSGGQDPPHLRNRLKHVLLQIEAEADGRPLAGPLRPAPRQHRGQEAVDGDVGREPPADGEQDRGVPIGLADAQLAGHPVTRARQAITVLAWVPFTGGRYHQVRAWAGEWTASAVHLRWRDNAGAWDVWVHAVDVQRSSSGRISGLPATMRSDTLAYPDNRNPRRPDPE